MLRKRFIDPQGLERIAKMELVARHTVEGFLAGRHRSPHHGTSVEYSDHRPYSVGDELRMLDWKLLARTDKYYVKLFEDQTNLRCTVMLDVSRSMGFSAGKRMTKLEYGCYLTAAVAYLLLHQGDAVGLALVDNKLQRYLPARATASHFRTILELLEEGRASEPSRMAGVMHELAGRVKRRGLVILVSDLLDDPAEILGAIDHFRYRKHEVIVFHVMDPHELEFPYDGPTRFKDIEGSGIVVTNAAAIRGRYMERLRGFMETLKTGCLQRDVSYEVASTGVPWSEMLTGYLAKRSRMG